MATLFARTRLRPLLYAAGAAAVCGLLWWAWPAQPAAMPTPILTPDEKTRMDTLTRDMTPRCFGRYIIDLPRQFEPNFRYWLQLDGYSQNDILFDIQAMSKPEFDFELAEYEQKLKSTKLTSMARNEPGSVMFQSIEASPNIAHGKVFNRVRTYHDSDNRRKLELWAWKEGYFIRIQINADDGRREVYKQGSYLQTQYNVPEKLKILLGYYDRTSGRRDDEVPTGVGFCIQNGFIAGKVDPDAKEKIILQYNLKGTRDVSITLESNSLFAEENTMVDRIDDAKRAVGAEGFIRGGATRSNANIEGGEILTEGETNVYDINDDDKRIIGHMFAYEAHSKQGTVQQPILVVHLDNGSPQDYPPDSMPGTELGFLDKASLSRAEAVALWDAIIPTIRPRPGAF